MPNIAQGIGQCRPAYAISTHPFARTVAVATIQDFEDVEDVDINAIIFRPTRLEQPSATKCGARSTQQLRRFRCRVIGTPKPRGA